MRTTLRIDDDLLRILKDQAHREGIRFTELVNRVLRKGLEASSRPAAKRTKRYREQSFALGAPAVNLNKALGLAAALEDEELLDKLARRK